MASLLHVRNHEHVGRGKLVAEWTPRCDKIIATREGIVQLTEIIRERGPDGSLLFPTVIGSYGPEYAPALTVVDGSGSPFQTNYLDKGTIVHVKHDAAVQPGDLLAEWHYPSPVNLKFQKATCPQIEVNAAL